MLLLYSHTSFSAQDECTAVCLCCPLCLWSVSMEHLCTGESYQRYKYVWAYMWVEREHVTPDQLCCSNALIEFRLRGNIWTWINSSALMHLQSSDSGGNIWHQISSFSTTDINTHMLCTFFWGQNVNIPNACYAVLTVYGLYTLRSLFRFAFTKLGHFFLF